MSTAETRAGGDHGGSFLLRGPGATLAPERFNDQEKLIAQTAERFAREEILPSAEAIEQADYARLRGLLRASGELGLTGVDVAEAYGGLGMNHAASAIVADHLAVLGSFSVAFGAHAGIGTLPLALFGNDDQKRRYLPRLATAEWVAAYALSEAGSGSDALAMRTQAALSSDGNEFVLNGEKMWISNAGIADLFTVFARTGETISAFLIEAKTPGLATGPEEHKMGLLGSSTRAVRLQEVRVPRQNLLGQLGDGAHIAFRILNVGRFKLGAACLGGARQGLRDAVAYARQRHAFGRPISDFGLIRLQLGAMALHLYAAESAVYRTAQLLDDGHELDEYAIECAIVKVHASEMLDRVVDADVQIHGGNGFVRGNPAERAYRDARVNRIFEGTNEINRLLISGTMLRRAQQGRLALLPEVERQLAALLEPPAAASTAEQARTAALLVAGVAYRRHGAALENEQTILAALADLAIAVFVLQAVEARRGHAALAAALAAETLDSIEVTARRALCALSEGDELRTQLAWLRRVLRREPVDLYRLQLELGARQAEFGGYAI
jgi:alkylation response protein AidB-like acyl-CoA dehydrogenase